MYAVHYIIPDIKQKISFCLDYLEHYLCHNQILVKMNKQTNLMKEMDEKIDKNILFNRVTAKQIDDNKMFFQVMMGNSEFNHYNTALKTLDSFQVFLSQKRKRNTLDMILHKQEHIR